MNMAVSIVTSPRALPDSRSELPGGSWLKAVSTRCATLQQASTTRSMVIELSPLIRMSAAVCESVNAINCCSVSQAYQCNYAGRNGRTLRWNVLTTPRPWQQARHCELRWSMNDHSWEFVDSSCGVLSERIGITISSIHIVCTKY